MDCEKPAYFYQVTMVLVATLSTVALLCLIPIRWLSVLGETG